ncbi:RNA polymerase sigma factor [Streptomyces sp. NPDC051662]|uniref:RNA polymerase sigma factor n=1 Tax=Streptomyces sp. NPDC051662 TaxID=3154750 RepID=UPI00343E2854
MNHSPRARIRAGDPAEFGRLFEDYARIVYRYAMRVTGDWATAEDVVSLTFLEAWRLRERVHAEGESLRPWLLGIATNVLRNSVRTARRHDLALARLPEPEAVPDFAEGLAARLADSEELAAARVALGGLRRAEREVFTLCVWEGLDHAAVAKALGVAVGTVRSRLSRARGRLRQLTEAELRRSRARNGGGARDSGAQYGRARNSKGESVREDTQRLPSRGQFIASRTSAVASAQEGNR